MVAYKVNKNNLIICSIFFFRNFYRFILCYRDSFAYICAMKQRVVQNITESIRSASQYVLLFLCGVVSLLSVVGCGKSVEEVNSVERAESLLKDHPEEALAIMESIDRSTILDNRELAYYSLIYSEACYYNRKLIASDSLTSISVNYYHNRNNHDLRARAYFQHGMVMNLSKQYPEAVIALSESLKSIANYGNVRLEGVVHRTMGDVYRAHYCYKNSYQEYVLAHKCFSILQLPYHTYYTKYNMGQAAVKLRNYDEAEQLFIEARDYSIATGDMNLLCTVLHELCDLYLKQDDYDSCREVVALFEEYDCVLWFVSRYYAVRAIVCSEAGEDNLALQYLAMAEEQTYRDEAIIDEAKYITYKNMGDMTNALYWLERTNSRLSETLLQASDQPVLNYQIDLLRSSLDKEEHALKITRQRNISVYVAIAIIVSLIVGIFRGFSAKKDRDIQRYIETIHELQLTTHTTSDTLSEAVDHLYNDRLNDLNRLCETYYEHSDTARHTAKVFEQVRETIESIKSDEARLEELERVVNQCRGNLMQKLREQCPKLNVKEQRVVLYSYAGFSSRAICVFMETNPVALSKMKYRIKLKIKECEAKDADLLISSIGER